MENMADEGRQEVLLGIIDECKRWLNEIIEEEKDAEQETTRYLAEIKQKVEQIVTGFKMEADSSLVEEKHKGTLGEKVS